MSALARIELAAAMGEVYVRRMKRHNEGTRIIPEEEREGMDRLERIRISTQWLFEQEYQEEARLSQCAPKRQRTD